MAQEASSILRLVELEQFSTPPGSATLYSGSGAISDDVLTIINHWSLATGRNLKIRTPETAGPGPRGVQAVRPSPMPSLPLAGSPSRSSVAARPPVGAPLSSFN
jgi:hypothetical protein